MLGSTLLCLGQCLLAAGGQYVDTTAGAGVAAAGLFLFGKSQFKGKHQRI